MSPVSRGRKPKRSKKSKNGKKPPVRTISSGWARTSPHRSEYFRELIDDWSDDPVTDAVRALLPAWVRWNGEQAGVPASLLERAVGAASART